MAAVWEDTIYYLLASVLRSVASTSALQTLIAAIHRFVFITEFGDLHKFALVQIHFYILVDKIMMKVYKIVGFDRLNYKILV